MSLQQYLLSNGIDRQPVSETTPLPVTFPGGAAGDLATATNQTAANALLTSAVAALQDTTTPVPTIGYTINAAATQFTRPTDTTAYTSGDIVANSTTAASVVALEFTVGRINAGSGMIRKARVRKSTAGVTNASFRLHLFKVAPTVATAGDNAVFTNVSGVANYVGAFDITVDRAFADGAAGAGGPVTGSEINFVCAAADTKLYGLLEARGAYTPGNAETFNVSLEAIQN